MIMDEFLHLVKHAAGQQQQDYRPFMRGIIQSYDPSTQRVKVTIPCLADENGNPTLSPWMPLGSPWAGNGFGMQVAPLGGEEVIVDLIERGRGVTACAYMVFNNTHLPPQQGLSGGEAIIQHSSGSFVRFFADGSVFIHAVKTYAWDVDGYGQSVTSGGGGNYTVNNYTQGAIVTTNNLNINPPEIPVS